MALVVVVVVVVVDEDDDGDDVALGKCSKLVSSGQTAADVGEIASPSLPMQRLKMRHCSQ